MCYIVELAHSGSKTKPTCQRQMWTLPGVRWGHLGCIHVAAAIVRLRGVASLIASDGSIASTPEPPYVAVIFTSVRRAGDEGYAAMSRRMAHLAAVQPGYLGVESAKEGLGITVSYWRDESAATGWKSVAEHLVAQRRGRQDWYADYDVRVAVVQRDYGPNNPLIGSG